MPKESVEQLVKNVNARTPDSYTALHGLVFRELFVFSYRITQNEAETEDIISNAFIKLYTSSADKQFPHISALRGFMYTLVRNESIVFKKSVYARDTKELKMGAALKESPDCIMDMLEGKFRETLWALRHERVTEIMAMLDEKSVQVVRMIYLEGKTYHEVAKIMGLRPQTIQNHKGDGLKKIRKTYQKQGWAPEIFVLLIFIGLY